MMIDGKEIDTNAAEHAEVIGWTLADAILKLDNWSPTTCELEELAEHIAGIEMIESIMIEISNRAIYLRGVMAGRIIHECSRDD